MFEWIKTAGRDLTEPADEVTPERYTSLRRSITLLMVVVSVTPLLILTGINHGQYQNALQKELTQPLRGTVSKTRTSLELFLSERTSTVSLLSKTYTFEELSDPDKLTHIFRALKSEFQGFVDLGLLDETGRQIGYVGPYPLTGVDYSEQPWFRNLQLKNVFISDVYLGMQKTPHIVVAVSHVGKNGKTWFLRTTIDMEQLNRLVSTMDQSSNADIFLLNRKGVFQTDPRSFGTTLQKAAFPVPPVSYEAQIITGQDSQKRNFIAAYAYIHNTDFVLMAAKRQKALFQPWEMLQSDLLIVLALSITLIVLVSYGLMRWLIARLKASDERRVAAFAQMEHDQKLSSIGRLAAGVAHEVNNPLAIINEKAGLGLDMLAVTEDFSKKDTLTQILQNIESTVDRARNITHRLLGFARRMEIQHQELYLGDVIEETLGFLEREAKNRGVTITTEIPEQLPEIFSDRGQLQQVFLNIIGNALAAVDNGGYVDIRCTTEKNGFIRTDIRDNGTGMSPEVLRHIFEPFFSTKQEKGNGLGMFITYGIMKRLGGDIKVESRPGKGTCVSVFFPPAAPGEENKFSQQDEITGKK